MDTYPLAKALHIIGFVSWFAGLFYIIRLFIYRVEAQSKSETERDILEAQLAIMSRRLWFGITWPAMIFTLGCGTWLLVQYGLYSMPWVHMKLTLVALLVGYHLITHRIYRQLRAHTCRWSSKGLRIWNEVATLLLLAIVFVAVFKESLHALWATFGFIGFAMVLMIGIKVYGKVRAKA